MRIRVLFAALFALLLVGIGATSASAYSGASGAKCTNFYTGAYVNEWSETNWDVSGGHLIPTMTHYYGNSVIATANEQWWVDSKLVNSWTFHDNRSDQWHNVTATGAAVVGQIGYLRYTLTDTKGNVYYCVNRYTI